MVGQRIKRLAIGGKVGAYGPFVIEAAEKPGPYTLVVDALCMFLADPASFETLVYENHTAETANQKSDGSHRQSYRGSSPETHLLPPHADGISLSGSELKAEGEGETEGRIEHWLEGGDHQGSHQQAEKALQTVLAHYRSDIGRQRPFRLPILFLLAGHPEQHGDEGNVEQMVDYFAEKVISQPPMRSDKVIEYQQDDPGNDRGRDQEPLEESNSRSQQCCKQQRE